MSWKHFERSLDEFDKQKLTPEEAAEIRVHAARLRESMQGLNKVVRKNRALGRKGRFTAHRPEMQAMRDAGSNLQEIASRFGCSVSYVHQNTHKRVVEGTENPSSPDAEATPTKK